MCPSPSTPLCMCWGGKGHAAASLLHMLQIRKLLVVDPSKRLTAEEAMSHPWLCFVKVHHTLTEQPTAVTRLHCFSPSSHSLCNRRFLPKGDYE